MRVTRAIISAALVVGLASPALAQEVEGVVVAVDGGEIVLDIGRQHGLGPDTTLRLYRRLVVQHPLTGEALEDRFPIGTARPAEIGERLTILRKPRKLTRDPAPGDFVVFGKARPKPAPKAARPTPAAQAAPAPARPADEVALEKILVLSLGQSPAARAQLYEAWLKNFSTSKYQAVVSRDLRRLRALAARPKVVAAPQPTAPPPPVALHVRPTEVRVGQRQPIAVGFAAHARIQKVRLYTFRDPNAEWHEQYLERDGDAYWRGALPEHLLAEPGEVHYLVEAIVNKVSHPVVGQATKPATVTVLELPALEQPQGHSQMTTSVRYVDFNSVGDAKDAYLQFEGSFAYDVNFEALKTVRVGVGLLDGEGGPTDEIDADPSRTETFSVNYAFAEGELALNEWVGVAARGYAGNHHQTTDGRSAAVAGFEARLRVGRADGTRITAGGAAMDVLGAQGFLHLDVAAVPRLPIRAGVVVTNLPVDADLGVQLEGQVGWQVNDLLTLHVLTGWNARTINHYGFTGGGGLTLDW